LSIGWYVPVGRRDRDAIARDYGVSLEAIDQFGLQSHTVAADEDHPSTMAAHATKSALAACGLVPDDLDLLIFAGITRDYPAPWIAAFSVLNELDAKRTAGFDLNNRCPGFTDAIWLASVLVRSGSHKHIAVCAGDRFDHLLGPPRKVRQISDVAYSAGAAAVIVSCDALNEIAAFSHMTNSDLSLHDQLCPMAGGTRRPIDATTFDEGMHHMQSTMKVAQAARLMQYLQEADSHNIAAVCKSAGFDEVDFLACAPLDIKAQLSSFAALEIDPDKSLFTLPTLGHMGAADAMIAIGLAIAAGRNLGRRVVINTRSVLYSNALAIRASKEDMGIHVGGVGLDIGDWCH